MIITDTFEDIMENYDPARNKTRPILSIYEKTKIIGLRLEQLARGAESTIDATRFKNIRDIVLQELMEKQIPFIIVRNLPFGVKEYWKLEDMIIQ